MVLNPDDLLIFKEREEESGKKATKKPKSPDQFREDGRPQPQQTQTTQQPEAQPRPQPQPQPQRHAAPKQAPPVQKPIQPQKPPEPEPEPNVEAPAPAIEMQEEISAPVQMEEIKVTSTEAPALSTANEEEADYSKLLGPQAVPKPEELVRVRNKKLRASESKKIASKMNCSIHPWRRGYAICDYCKKPYCYEDIMEYNGFFYCLDDIDKVSQSIRETLELKYTRLSILSSVLFFLVLLSFVYYRNGAVLTLVSTLQSSGLSAINTTTGLQNLLMAGDILFAVLTFISGILVLLGTSSSFKASALTGLVTVLLFSYQFLNNGIDVYGAIAAMSFVGLVSLAYSRVSEEVLPEESILTADVVSPTEFANTRGI